MFKDQCIHCDKQVVWVRATQFAGSHPFCNYHAKLEPDFGDDDWYKLNPELLYICDNKRHLVCRPYSIENLHKMADDLKIHRDWFHNKPGREHYDIPKKRIAEIQARCMIVSPKVLLNVIKSANG